MQHVIQTRLWQIFIPMLFPSGLILDFVFLAKVNRNLVQNLELLRTEICDYIATRYIIRHNKCYSGFVKWMKSPNKDYIHDLELFFESLEVSEDQVWLPPLSLPQSIVLAIHMCCILPISQIGSLQVRKRYSDSVSGLCKSNLPLADVLQVTGS